MTPGTTTGPTRRLGAVETDVEHGDTALDRELVDAQRQRRPQVRGREHHQLLGGRGAVDHVRDGGILLVGVARRDGNKRGREALVDEQAVGGLQQRSVPEDRRGGRGDLVGVRRAVGAHEHVMFEQQVDDLRDRFGVGVERGDDVIDALRRAQCLQHGGEQPAAGVVADDLAER